MEALEPQSQEVSTVGFRSVPDEGDSVGTISLGERRGRAQGIVVKAVGVGVSAATLTFAPGQVEAAPSIASLDETSRSVESKWSLESLPQSLSQALTKPGRDANPVATDAAARVLNSLAGNSMRPERVVVARSGNVAITFVNNRRYATLECDSDGDVVLALTDRSGPGEATAVVVTDSAASDLSRQIRSFLEH